MNVDRPQDVRDGVQWFPARTPTLPPATHTNSYAIGTREVVLVEPATPHDDERRAWLQWARGLVSKGRELRAIFVTHHHVDHVGGAEHFARELGIELWAHARTGELLEPLQFGRFLRDGDTIELAGPTLQRWHCLHTPGHAPGHVCLHEQTLDVLIVGDMVASVGTILIGPDGDLGEYLRQLKRLASLDAAVALPAHGDPIEGPTKLFEHYIAHRLMREDKVVEALRQLGPEGGEAHEMLPVAYDDTPKLLWPLAKVSIDSHLLKLAEDGRAERCDAGWRLSR